MTTTAKKAVYKIRTLQGEERTSSKKTAIELAEWLKTEFPGRCIVVEKHIGGNYETILLINGE